MAPSLVLEILLDDRSLSNISGIAEGKGVAKDSGYRKNRIKCILQPSTMDEITTAPDSNKITVSPVDVYGNLTPPGTRVRLLGYWPITTPKIDRMSDYDSSSEEPILALWVANVRLLRCSWRPSIIQYFLSLLAGDNKDTNNGNAMHRNEAKRSYYYPFELDEVSNALNLPGGYNEAQELQKACAAEGATEIQWRAAEISRRLQGENSRVGTLTDEMKVTLKKFSQVREDWPLNQVGHAASNSVGYPNSLSTDIATQTPDIKHMETAKIKTMGSILVNSQEGSRWCVFQSHLDTCLCLFMFLCSYLLLNDSSMIQLCFCLCGLKLHQ